MAGNHRAPKQWCLTRNETITSFDSWRHNLLYTLSLDAQFAPFLVDGYTWLKKTTATPMRGLLDDGADVPEAQRRTAVQKLTQLELMLGQIANFCPVISRNSIVKASTSVADIWQKIRQHFGFASTGGHFLDLAHITLQPDERPEDLFQRLTAFYEDNLLTPGCGVTHHGVEPDTEEEITPSVENTIVLLWMQLVHPGLPALVKQRYGAELRNKSLASIKVEVSQAMDSLLEELRNLEDTRSLRATGQNKPHTTRPRNSPSCILCITARRTPSDHFLSKCTYLPPEDKKYLLKSRFADVEDVDEFDTVDEPDYQSPDLPVVNRISVIQSPYIDTFYRQTPVRLTLDSGATANMISEACARSLGAKITRSSQTAYQADGSSTLQVAGETRLVFTRDSHSFSFDGLVIKFLDVDVLGASPFWTITTSLFVWLARPLP